MMECRWATGVGASLRLFLDAVLFGSLLVEADAEVTMEGVLGQGLEELGSRSPLILAPDVCLALRPWTGL